MINEYQIGAFRGRKLIQRRGEVGGAKSVFVKLQGIKNELVYPTFGGRIMNPPKGGGKIFAGDLMLYKTNDDGVKPEIWVLRTYKTYSGAFDGNDRLLVEKTPYSHKPFVGQVLGIDTGVDFPVSDTVTKVESITYVGKEWWALTGEKSWAGLTAEVLDEYNYVLEELWHDEGGASGWVTIGTPNAVADSDADMLDEPATGDDDFDGARYMYTPALGGLMYTKKMSPLPKRILALNESKVNGWFKIGSWV